MINLPINEIKKGATFISANRRLASYVISEYDKTAVKKGELVWETPVIIPWAAWLVKLRGEARPELPLISDIRARTLWEEVLRDDVIFKEERILLEGGVIKSAYDAYALIMEYGLGLEDEDIYSTPETRALSRWISLYKKRLLTLGFADRLDLPDEIARLILRERIKPPTHLILGGFDEITPQIALIVKALANNGCNVDFWPNEPAKKGAADEQVNLLESLPDALSLECFEDELEEVVEAARWIRKIYRPGMKIGIIVPSLGAYKDIIRREFTAELFPSSNSSSKYDSRPFNISLGESLSDAPIIRFALNLLSLNAQSHDLNLISSILLSPFSAKTSAEKMQLAKIDASLKKESRTTISVSQLRSMLSGDSAPFMSACLKHLEEINKEGIKRQSPSKWSKDFDGFTQKFIQPLKGDGISSVEYQALGAFAEVLSSLASLDDITGTIDRKAAISRLRKITREKIHQPETSESSIEVMGLLESAGLSFDYIRIIGAHDKALPGEPSPNPFIPINIQKEHNLPRSNFERELHFALVQINRIINSTSNIIVSVPKTIGKLEVNISPLFNAAKINEDLKEISTSARLIDQVHCAEGLEEMPLDFPLPVSKNELEGIRGGTAILKNQSDCPFRAFAVYRLFSGAIDEPEAGINAMERGNLVHKAMEIFWEKVENSAGLKKIIEEGNLHTVISEAADAGFKQASPSRKLGKHYIGIERERLSSLMAEWLEIEANRCEFSAISRESEKELIVGGLPIRARIDRIDEFTGGGKALIDYKTGSSGISDWLTDRPKEPQLMLYAMSGEYEAVSFARLKRGDSKFAGIAREADMLPKVDAFGDDKFSKKTAPIADWNELMSAWKDTLTDLGESFMKGDAAVDPRGYGNEGSACKYCEQSPLCRVFEADAL